MLKYYNRKGVVFFERDEETVYSTDTRINHQDRHTIGVDFELTPKLGFFIGKRGYFDITMPIKIVNIDYGRDYRYGQKAGGLREGFLFTNYLKTQFSKPDYQKRFYLQFAIGYRI